jgi:hypothetical protein
MDFLIIEFGLFFEILHKQIKRDTIKRGIENGVYQLFFFNQKFKEIAKRNKIKLKRMKPGGSILLLKLTKLTNLTKPKLMKKNVMQM